MQKEVFLERFHKAIEGALSNARKSLIEVIPSVYKFELEYRNGSKDGLFTIEQATDVLYKDSKVPRWVHIFFLRLEDDLSIIGCELSNDYFEHDSQLLYEEGGVAPFRVGFPSLPEPYKEGKKFSIRDLKKRIK